jgi:hypothetical protein
LVDEKVEVIVHEAVAEKFDVVKLFVGGLKAIGRRIGGVEVAFEEVEEVFFVVIIEKYW